MNTVVIGYDPRNRSNRMAKVTAFVTYVQNSSNMKEVFEGIELLEGCCPNCTPYSWHSTSKVSVSEKTQISGYEMREVTSVRNRPLHVTLWVTLQNADSSQKPFRPLHAPTSHQGTSHGMVACRDENSDCSLKRHKFLVGCRA